MGLLGQSTVYTGTVAYHAGVYSPSPELSDCVRGCVRAVCARLCASCEVRAVCGAMAAKTVLQPGHSHRWRPRLAASSGAAGPRNCLLRPKKSRRRQGRGYRKHDFLGLVAAAAARRCSGRVAAFDSALGERLPERLAQLSRTVRGGVSSPVKALGRVRPLHQFTRSQRSSESARHRSSARGQHGDRAPNQHGTARTSQRNAGRTVSTPHRMRTHSLCTHTSRCALLDNVCSNLLTFFFESGQAKVSFRVLTPEDLQRYASYAQSVRHRFVRSRSSMACWTAVALSSREPDSF
jgi:hypothetical protein